MAKCTKCDTEYSDDISYCEKCSQRIELPGKAGITEYRGIARGIFTFYWPMLLAAVLFVVMQWGFPFVDWWKSWDKPHSYYSHGPLVPLISLFMVWANRKRLASERLSPSWTGLILLIPSVPLFVFGRWTGSGIVCALTFFGFLIGALLLFTGWRITRLLLFPILYLAFMIPAPATLLDNTTFRIQYASTTLAAKMLQLTGYDVAQVGSEIRGSVLPDTLRVGVACSGFRMLISLLTFTAFFVYMLRAQWWKKLVLVALAFPLSVFVNGLRIASIGYIGIWTGSAKNMMKFHDTWAMVFELVLSFAILFGFARLIKANDFGVPDPVPSQKGESGRGRLSMSKSAAVIACFLLVTATNAAVRPLEATAKGFINEADFPKGFGHWVSQSIALDPVTERELKTAAMVQRLYRYTIDDLPDVQVLVQAAADTDAFHDPHSCIPGGGSSIVDEKKIVIRMSKPRPMSVNATMLRSVSGTGNEFVLIYWYDTESETYATTSQIRWKMRLAQIRDIRDLLLRRTTNEALRLRNLKRQTYCYRFSAFMGDDAERDHAALLGFIKQFVANAKSFK